MRKTILTFSLALMSVISIYAQNQNWCGTVYTKEWEQWREDNAYLNEVAAKRDNAIYYIPVKFHVFGKDDGTGYYKNGDILVIMNKINRDYEQVGFRFYLAGNTTYLTSQNDIDRIPSTYYYSGQYLSRNELFVFNKQQNVLNVYIMNSVTGLCGRANFPCDPNTVKLGGLELISSCIAADNSTFAHEAGHWLSLPHPFDISSGCKECVDGSNCDKCGDRFCDTPADYKSDRWNCGDLGEVDACGSGNKSNPDGTLYMSYSNDACCTRFSNEQINGNTKMIGMRASLLSSCRKYLITYSDPPKDSIKLAQSLVLPNNGDTIDYRYSILNWNSVSGATMYHIMISKYSTFSNLTVDYFTSDTFYYTSLADKLISGTKYYWKVKPFNPVYTAAPYSSSRMFTASTLIPLGIKNNINTQMEIQFYPNLIKENKQIILSVNSNKPVQAQSFIYDISGKIISSTDYQFVSGNNTHLIDVSGLTHGIYLFRLQGDDLNFKEKFIVVD